MGNNATMNEETILIIEDDGSIREGVRILMEAEGYHMEEAENGYAGIKIVKDTERVVDLILLDIMMPGLSGIKTCQEIRKISNAPILFLTAKGQESDKTLGFSSGGDDYLTKPFSYNELNVRVKALLRRYHVYQGKKEEAKAIIRLNDLEIDQEHKEVYLNKNKLSLTDIEYEILDYLILNRKQVISASQLFETIWHENYYYGANNTIMVHIRNLRKKIEEDPQNPRIIKTVWGKGYYID